MQREFELPSILVEIGTAQQQQLTHVISTRGTVSPRTQTTMVSEVSGQIVNVAENFVRGGFFKKGDMLLTIDPRNYQSALKSAEAEVAGVKTRLETEQAQASYALQDWQRLKERIRETPAPTALALRRPQMNEVLAQLASAEARLEKAQEDLSRTVIQAPYDGMILEKRADIGQFINAGSPFADTIAVDFAEVRLPLSLTDLEFIDLPSGPGTHLPVVLSTNIAGQEKSWQASVVRSEGVIDTASRAIYVVAQIEDPYDLKGTGENTLRIGSFVSALITGRDAGMVFALPRHAVNDGVVWLVDDENKIFPRNVDVIRADEESVYISEGLSNGEIYCITSLDQPLPGMKVRYSDRTT